MIIHFQNPNSRQSNEEMFTGTLNEYDINLNANSFKLIRVSGLRVPNKPNGEKILYSLTARKETFSRKKREDPPNRNPGGSDWNNGGNYNPGGRPGGGNYNPGGSNYNPGGGNYNPGGSPGGSDYNNGGNYNPGGRPGGGGNYNPGGSPGGSDFNQGGNDWNNGGNYNPGEF